MSPHRSVFGGVRSSRCDHDPSELSGVPEASEVGPPAITVGDVTSAPGFTNRCSLVHPGSVGGNVSVSASWQVQRVSLVSASMPLLAVWRIKGWACSVSDHGCVLPREGGGLLLGALALRQWRRLW